MPVVETVEWNGVTWRRYPEAKKRNHRVYFQHHFSASEPPLYLHREIYKAHNGAIPEGGHIHHKDENPSNNRPDNLECVTAAEHRGRHAGVCSDKMRANLDVQREKTKAWHSSDEGRAWHSKMSIESAKKRSLHTHTCKACGKEFQTKRKSCLHCSGSCRDSQRAKRLPIHPATCKLCGKDFLSLKKTAGFCSYSCSNKSRSLHPC